MGIRRLMTLLPLAVPSARAQTDNMFDADDAPESSGVNAGAPNYTPEECGYWSGLFSPADADSSGGLSEAEYLSFLSSIADPPYVSEFFLSFGSFDRLPWSLRVVHKSLACQCEKVGFGEGCCEGDSAEILTPGFVDSAAGAGVAGEGAGDYSEFLCDLLSYVLRNSVPSPAPTYSPSEGPTASPSAGPTGSPSDGPTGSPSTARPSESPSTKSPSAGPTDSPSLAPSTPGPTTSPVAPPTGAPSSSPRPSPGRDMAGVLGAEALGAEDSDGGGGGVGIGGIIGIFLAILLVVVVALVVHRRRRERATLTEFAGAQAPEGDLEAQFGAKDGVPLEPEPEASREPGPALPGPREDDESSEPSVWSESDDEGRRSRKEVMHDEKEAPGRSAGSSLAAIGAASTVAANLTSPSPRARRE